MRLITIWERLDPETGRIEHNHIDDGHVTTDVPIPNTDLQKKAWKGALWYKHFGYIDADGHVTITAEDVD
jgi:hypothetical protein